MSEKENEKPQKQFSNSRQFNNTPDILAQMDANPRNNWSDIPILNKL